MTDWQLATHRSTGQRYWCKEIKQHRAEVLNQHLCSGGFVLQTVAYEIRTPYHVKGDTYDLGAPLSPERSAHSGTMPADTFERLYELEEV